MMIVQRSELGSARPRWWWLCLFWAGRHPRLPALLEEGVAPTAGGPFEEAFSRAHAWLLLTTCRTSPSFFNEPAAATASRRRPPSSYNPMNISFVCRKKKHSRY